VEKAMLAATTNTMAGSSVGDSQASVAPRMNRAVPMSFESWLSA
jgi:hypothetical protein